MKPESRAWFDAAYVVTGGLPFALATSPTTEEGVKWFFANYYKREISDEDAKMWTERFTRLYEMRPPAEDFKEEKRTILEKLLPDLYEKLSFVETCILFGSLIGDIDLGLITPQGISEEGIYEAVPKSMADQYSIVDWNSIFYFRCRSGAEFVDKIIRSRLDRRDIEGLDQEEEQYVRDTINTTIVLWGNQEELAAMKSALEEKLAAIK